MELEDTSTFFYDLPSTTPRRSKFVLPGLDQNKLRVFNLANVFKIDPTKKLASDFVYHCELLGHQDRPTS
jgi:UDP-glucose:glycoprotein glucosyltransferase